MFFARINLPFKSIGKVLLRKSVMLACGMTDFFLSGVTYACIIRSMKKTKLYTFSLIPALMDVVRKVAAGRGQTLSGFVTVALKLYLESEKEINNKKP